MTKEVLKDALAKGAGAERASTWDLSPDELEGALTAAMARARKAWPGIDVRDVPGYVAYLGERLPEDLEPLPALEKLRCEDLWLAFSCLEGNGKAVASFRRAYAPRLQMALVRLGTKELVEDVIQRLHERLFVGDEKRPPAISKFAGKGELGKWLEVLAVRDAYRQLRKEGKETLTGDEELLDRVAAGGDPELSQLKRSYRDRFKAAFQQAFETLSPRHRNLLRYQYLDGLNIDQMGVIFGVHRATVARWRADARARLFAETRKILVAELQVPEHEFESIMRLIQSQLDVSLPRLLKLDVKKDE